MQFSALAMFMILKFISGLDLSQMGPESEDLRERGVLSTPQGNTVCDSYNTDKRRSPGEPNCNLNRQKWFVLLQAAIL
jgi:hypothetical protein